MLEKTQSDNKSFDCNLSVVKTDQRQGFNNDQQILLNDDSLEITIEQNFGKKTESTMIQDDKALTKQEKRKRQKDNKRKKKNELATLEKEQPNDIDKSKDSYDESESKTTNKKRKLNLSA